MVSLKKIVLLVGLLFASLAWGQGTIYVYNETLCDLNIGGERSGICGGGPMNTSLYGCGPGGVFPANTECIISWPGGWNNSYFSMNSGSGDVGSASCGGGNCTYSVQFSPSGCGNGSPYLVKGVDFIITISEMEGCGSVAPPVKTNVFCFQMSNSGTTPQYHYFQVTQGGSTLVYSGCSSNLFVTDGTNVVRGGGGGGGVGAATTPEYMAVYPGENFQVCLEESSTAATAGDVAYDMLAYGQGQAQDAQPCGVSLGQERCVTMCMNSDGMQQSPYAGSGSLNQAAFPGGAAPNTTNSMPVGYVPPTAGAQTSNGYQFPTMMVGNYGTNAASNAVTSTLVVGSNTDAILVTGFSGVYSGLSALAQTVLNAAAATNGAMVSASSQTTAAINNGVLDLSNSLFQLRNGVNSNSGVMNSNIANVVAGISALGSNLGNGGQWGPSNIVVNLTNGSVSVALPSNIDVKNFPTNYPNATLEAGVGSLVTNLSGASNAFGYVNVWGAEMSELESNSMLLGATNVGYGSNAGFQLVQSWSNAMGPSPFGEEPVVAPVGDGADLSLGFLPGSGAALTMGLHLANLPPAVVAQNNLIRDLISALICCMTFLFMLECAKKNIWGVIEQRQMQGVAGGSLGGAVSLPTAIFYAGVVMAFLATIPVLLSAGFTNYRAPGFGVIKAAIEAIVNNSVWADIVLAAFPLQTLIVAMLDCLFFDYVVMFPFSTLVKVIIMWMGT